VNSQTLESQVIGGLLLGGATPDAYTVLSSLPEEAFSIRQFREAYAEIKRQALSKSIIDPVMISQVLGGESFADLSQAAKDTWSYANLKGYADEVRKAWHKRRVIEIVSEAHRGIESSRNSEESDAIVSSLQKQLIDITADQSAVVPVHMKDLLENYLTDLESRQNGDVKAQTIKFGMPNFDQEVGGLNQTDLLVLAARPSMGKTEYALNLIRGVTNDGGGALMFSMEMTSGQITERTIAGSGGLSVRKLKNPDELRDEDWARISMGVAEMTSKDIWMVDATDLSIEQIRAVAETHKRRYPHLRAIFVDYIGLIKKPKAERNDIAVGHISRNLKFMAMQLKTPVIALSQLSRKVEERTNKRPINSDLRDSGDIEQDADVIAMLYRDEYYNEASPAKGIAEVIIGKNRNGETGTVFQAFRNGHFSEIDQTEAANASAERAPAKGRYTKGEF
jgi:replicative DNA helicase